MYRWYVHVHFTPLCVLQLVKVEVDTCAWHTDCASCVGQTRRYREPLGCGWCDGACVQRSQCASQQWFDSTCPPVIHSVSCSTRMPALKSQSC